MKFLFATVLVFLVCLGDIKAKKAKPNIIVIFADDLNYNDLSCYGGAYSTPILDQMAAEGFQAKDCIVPANVCSPSRASLLTGRYPMRNGYPLVGNFGLHEDELTIPELLKPAGYHTLAVGKWHLGFHYEGSHPMDAGFDEYIGFPHNFLDGKGKADRSLYRGREKIKENIEFEEITPFYNKEVAEFIQREKDNPFFIYMAHQIAHTPILPSSSFKGKTKKGLIADFVYELDHSVGTVLQALKDADIERETLVVFLADNGSAGKRPIMHLSGSKFNTMEGGHRVPCVFRWTGTIPEGQVSQTTISSMDLLPLFCDLAGVKTPKDRVIDGKNIRNVILGKTKKSPHEFLYYYNGKNLQAVRQGNWKLHLPRTVKDQPFWGRKAMGDIFFFLELDKPYLVNFDPDLKEKNNLADKNPEIVKRLMDEATRIRAELGDVNLEGTDQRVAEFKAH